MICTKWSFFNNNKKTILKAGLYVLEINIVRKAKTKRKKSVLKKSPFLKEKFATRQFVFV